jgi:hypothetical protein
MLIIFGTLNNKNALSYDNSSLSNENSKTSLKSNTVKRSKSNRMISSFYRFEEKDIIRMHSHIDESYSGIKNKNLGEELNENFNFQESPTFSTMESSYISMSTNSNSVSRNPKNSDCIEGEQKCSYFCINM